MRVNVEIAFSFKHRMDPSYKVLDLPENSTVEDALHCLASRDPEFRARVLGTAADVKRHIHALVNGIHVQHRAWLNTPLHEGDRLSILPPMGGG